jgi:GAF domain-containing protein
MPEELRACAVPIVVAAEPLGMLVLALEETEPLDAEIRQLLRAISAGMGFALLRDRLVADLRAAADAA